MRAIMTGLREVLPATLPQGLLYQGGNPEAVRSWIATLEREEASWAILAAASGVMYGPQVAYVSSKASKKSKKYAEDGRVLQAFSATWFAKYSQITPGLTHNTLISSLPEVTLVLFSALYGQSRPLPALLQLPLGDDFRELIEAQTEAAIGFKADQKGGGKGKSRQQAANTARRLQLENPITRIFITEESEQVTSRLRKAFGHRHRH